MTVTLLTAATLPERVESLEALDALLATPSQALIDDLAAIDGDIMVLGASGKMGPSLAMLARNALPAERRVIAVARFSDPAAKAALEAAGVETITCDLGDRAALAALPRAKNIIYMAGTKFGSSGQQAQTWGANTYMPALVAEAFPEARIVAFSTGCVYAFADVNGQGSVETDVLDPPGEYAQSCIGRERMFEYFSQKFGTPGRIYRLNYAIDLRYGVLHDIAVKVRDGKPVDVTMGHVNVIWQGDANAAALRALRVATVPTTPLNVTGPETLPVRWLAHELARRMGVEAVITGQEAPKAWLNNAGEMNRLFGYPVVSLGRMLDWTAAWVQAGGASLGKPTKFEVRDGAY